MLTNNKHSVKESVTLQVSEQSNPASSAYRSLLREREDLNKRIETLAAARNQAINVVRLTCEKYDLTADEIFGQPKSIATDLTLQVTDTATRLTNTKAVRSPVLTKTPAKASRVKASLKATKAGAKKAVSPAKKKVPAVPGAAKSEMVAKKTLATPAARQIDEENALTADTPASSVALKKRTAGAKPSNNKDIAQVNPLPFTLSN